MDVFWIVLRKLLFDFELTFLDDIDKIVLLAGLEQPRIMDEVLLLHELTNAQQLIVILTFEKRDCFEELHKSLSAALNYL